ncbi:MAG: hypothetical protein D6826_02525, partial [Alphaproteobacteria bacterium]
MPASRWSVPRRWPGATIVCAASGPSLAAPQLARVRGRWPVIVVNDSWRLAPWADVLYAADWRWWRKHTGVPAFRGLKVTIANGHGAPLPWPEIKVLENTGIEGFERAPGGLRTGRNGGYQAINLAVHLGAARVVLLGYDMKPSADGRTHWFGDHEEWPTRPAIYRDVFLPHFDGLARALDEAGIAVVNCTPDSALDVFAKAPLAAVLADRLQPAA